MDAEIGVDYTGITTPFYCIDGKGNFLLHKRSVNTRDEHGTWDFGGGKLEFGMSPEENALKELSEEYGCKGKIREALPPWSSIREWNGKKAHWLAVPFIIEVDPAEVRNNEPHKIDEIGWFKLGAFPEPLHPGVQFALAHTKQQLEKYA